MVNVAKTNYSADNGNKYRPETIVVINCVLNGPLMLVSVIGNMLVLAAILRTPSLTVHNFAMQFGCVRSSSWTFNTASLHC